MTSRHVVVPTPPVVTLAYAGDSTTALQDSWLNQLDDRNILVVGGYAHNGYTSAEILSRIGRVHADVLVVMVGVNDFRFASTANIASIVANVNSIVAKVGAKHPLISAVAPSDLKVWVSSGKDPQKLQQQLNGALKRDANKHHWMFVDPYVLIRNNVTGAYLSPELTVDGIHPTQAGFAIVAAAMDSAISQADHPARTSR